MTEILHGLVTGVRAQNLGDRLAAAGNPADGVITVYDVADFNEGGGTLRVDDELVDYTGVDDDTNTVTLSTTLVSAHTVDTHVDIWDAANGQPAVAYFGVVGRIDGEELANPVEVVVGQGVAHVLAQEMRVGGTGESVTLVRHGSELHVQEVHGRAFALASLQYLQGGMTTRQSDTDPGVDVVGADSGAPGVYLYSAGGDAAALLDENGIRTAVSGGRTELSFTTDARDLRFYTGSSVPDSHPAFIGTSLVGSDTFMSIQSQPATGSFYSTSPSITMQNAALDSLGTTTVNSDVTVIHGGGFYIDNLSGGGTTGASLDASGKIIRTPSSRRYKSNIKPLPADLARRVLDLEPVTFTLKDEAKIKGRVTYPGFIAEQAAEVGADLWVTRNADGEPDGFRYAELTAALIPIIRDQQQQIDDLAARLAALEARQEQDT